VIVLNDFGLFMAKVLLNNAAIVKEYSFQEIVEFFALTRCRVDCLTHLNILYVLQ
jgi:hypothetical protein